MQDLSERFKIYEDQIHHIFLKIDDLTKIEEIKDANTDKLQRENSYLISLLTDE